MYVRYKPETPLSYFKEQLMNSETNQVKSVQFYTITGAIIPLCETVADLNDYPILCQINDKRVYAINFSHEQKFENNSTKVFDEENFFNYAAGIGLKGYSRYFYSNFSFKIMNALPKQKTLSNSDLS